MTSEELAAVREILKKGLDRPDDLDPDEIQAATWQAIDALDHMLDLDNRWGAVAHRVNNIIHEVDCLRKETA